LSVQYRFDDEVKEDDHGDFTPEMMKLPQATWIVSETFLEGVTDKVPDYPRTLGIPIDKNFVINYQ
jgi:hypothetical protein